VLTGRRGTLMRGCLFSRPVVREGKPFTFFETGISLPNGQSEEAEGSLAGAGNLRVFRKLLFPRRYSLRVELTAVVVRSRFFFFFRMFLFPHVSAFPRTRYSQFENLRQDWPLIPNRCSGHHSTPFSFPFFPEQALEEMSS